MNCRLGCLILLETLTLWGQKPENVLVVANRQSPVSQSIAEYYVRRRSIPAGNVCYIQTVAVERIQRQVYEQQIAQPVAHCLQQPAMAGKILYIVTTLGVPLAIQGTRGMEMTTDGAAVDSELSLLYSDMRGVKRKLDGPQPNPMFGKVDQPFDQRQFPMYLVTRLAGYSFSDVRGLIDRSLQAANRGQIVLDLKDGWDETGDDWLRDAGIRLPTGRVLLEESAKVVYGEKNVIGYGSWGSNDKAHKQRKVGFQWLPGAIMTEFVSTNGRTFVKPPASWTLAAWADGPSKWYKGSPQSLTADYVEEGVTGASGHVDEPFLSYCPRPDYLFPAYITKGRNLAESYYVALRAVSWMNIVIGDPLCRVGPAK